MTKMTLAHARKMRDGVLKGDSVIAQAWRELITGDLPSPAAEKASGPGASGDRGTHTLATMKAREEAW